MAIEITHVRFGSAREAEEEIVRYKWKSFDTGSIGENDKPTLVAWVNNGGDAYVGSGSNRVSVGAVKPQYGQAYLRTHADGKWTNNLLSLPKF